MVIARAAGPAPARLFHAILPVQSLQSSGQFQPAVASRAKKSRLDSTLGGEKLGPAILARPEYRRSFRKNDDD